YLLVPPSPPASLLSVHVHLPLHIHNHVHLRYTPYPNLPLGPHQPLVRGRSRLDLRREDNPIFVTSDTKMNRKFLILHLRDLATPGMLFLLILITPLLLVP
ncbi:hypothetical protein PQX77_021478, partial [Marasmius sp. AFHP31]